MFVLSVSPFQSDHQFLEVSAAGCRCRLSRAVDLAGALIILDEYDVSVVVCDHDSIPGNWRDLLQFLQERGNPAALIVTSRLADDRLWAEALNLGAWDVLAKPFDRDEVTRSIERAIQHSHSATARRTATGKG